MPGEHQADATRRRRLRWRSRRGLLENDLIITRFLDSQEARLTDLEVAGLDELLDLGDNELLDLILVRTEPDERFSAQARQVLALLRQS